MSARLAKLFLLAVVAAGLLVPAASQAKVPIYSLAPATSSTQAGAHANVALNVELGARGVTEPMALPCGCNALRDLKINTPAGLIAAPINIPRCTAAEFAIMRCPVDSQLGLVVIRFYPDDQGGFYNFMPLYNMEAGEDQLALLATIAPISQTPIYTDVTTRTESDYGLEFKTFGIPSVGPPNQITTLFWGVPADPVHDTVRIPFTGIGRENTPVRVKAIYCGSENPIPELLADEWGCPQTTAAPPPTSANSTVAPFVQNPTACLESLTFTVDTFAYDLGSDHADAPFPATTGCDQLSFDPALSAKPTTTEADSASGLDVDLTVPQSLSPSTPTPSAIRDVSVVLPPGFTINPNAADGKTACSDAEAKFGTRDQAQCPEFSKIGTLGVTSSSFPEVLPGAIYLGAPMPGNRYRVLLVFDGFSIHVKLPGTATPDPNTGQLTVSFSDLPQFNFQEFNMHVFGAERGLLATPAQCGTYPVLSRFVPWAAPDVPVQTSTQFFEIDSGPGGTPCPSAQRPFAPKVNAGVTDNTGGHHTNFVFDLTRKDGDQNLTAVKVVVPPGFSATLAGIPYCSEGSLGALAQSSYLGVAEQAAPACAASRVGTAFASAGAGSRPVSLSGNVYLAGPHDGAPLSLAVVTPAVSGPYDLGNVVVRVALRIDPVTAQVSAITDRLPQILEGIPLRLRRVVVMLDRPDFVLNPTNCDPFSVDTTVSGDQGAQVSLTSPFQAANCADLPYAPKLSLKLSGGVNRLGHPAIHAVFAAKPGEANSRRVSVTLPKGELLDNAHIGTPCTKVQFAASACPASSLLGSAEVTTPLLDRPLRGKAYLRSSIHELPDLAIDLRGQVDFQLVGRVDSVAARLRTTFETVPDVPVRRFVLDLSGGRKGLLQNADSLCGAAKRVTVRMTGQNGAVRDASVRLQASCAGNARHKRPSRRGGGIGNG
jgi:hypothetical protein